MFVLLTEAGPDTHGAFADQIDLLEKPFTEATLLTGTVISKV
jgi:hypothetical protein